MFKAGITRCPPWPKRNLNKPPVAIIRQLPGEPAKTPFVKRTPRKLKEVTFCMKSLFINQENVEEHLPKTIALEEQVGG